MRQPNLDGLCEDGEICGPYECVFCACDIKDCKCDGTFPDMELYCATCEKDIEVPYQELFDDDDTPYLDEEADEMPNITKPKKKKLEPREPVFHHTKKCRHYNVGLIIPTENGPVTVFPSSQHDRTYKDSRPDYGLYLDRCWTPSGIGYFIDWKDYGLPVWWDAAARTIIETFNKAKEGYWVEIGCIGGHGRTGTVLAAMCVLGGMKPKKAIKYVRDAYCSHAIETDEQEWWVSWFETFLHGGTIKTIPTWDYELQDYTKSIKLENVPYEEPTPQGSPPDQDSQTIHFEYITIDWVGEDGEPGYVKVDRDHENWDNVWDMYKQYVARKEAERQKKKKQKELVEV